MKMVLLTIISLACLTGQSLAVYIDRDIGGGGGWGGGIGVVSKRRVVSRRSAGSVYDTVGQMVADIVSKAKAEGGISAAELGQRASDLGMAIDSFLGDATVSAEDTEALIDAAAKDFNGATALSALFDDPLTFEASRLDAAICLLDKLGKLLKGKEGEAAYPVLAAMCLTVQAIETSVADSVAIIQLLVQSADADNAVKGSSGQPSKRWDFEAGVSHSEKEGTKVEGKVSHSWGKRRYRRDTAQVERTRRGKWTGSLGGGYNSKSGAHASVGIKYSWGR